MGFFVQASPRAGRGWSHLDHHRHVQPGRIHPAVRREHQAVHRRAVRAHLCRQRLDRRNGRIPGIGRRGEVIRNQANRGFPAAVNQGIAAAAGDQILLLNNDTIVTTGWLGRMLAALESDPKIGLVGPCSNSVGGEQRVDAHYDSLAGLDGFAWERGKAHDGAIEDTHRLIGFCLLIRRAVIDEIGLLDEQLASAASRMTTIACGDRAPDGAL